MNKLDGELVAGALRKGGYDFTDADEQADVVLMVTCSIRDQAEHRVHSHLGELAKLKQSRPDMVLGVLGCMASREGGPAQALAGARLRGRHARLPQGGRHPGRGAR